MVYIIFTNEQHADAEEIRDFLTEEKNLAASSSNLNWYELKNDNRIDQDAAVVLVSNAAVMDERWQDLVRDIPEYVRLIPVSSTRNADYTDPEMVPGKIREINYIRMGGRHLEDIWDSLTTEKGYYDIKNWILLNKNVWHFSKRSEDFLLSGVGGHRGRRPRRQRQLGHCRGGRRGHRRRKGHRSAQSHDPRRCERR